MWIIIYVKYILSNIGKNIGGKNTERYSVFLQYSSFHTHIFVYLDIITYPPILYKIKKNKK